MSQSKQGYAFEQYQRSASTEIRDYVPGESLSGIGVSASITAAGGPRAGDKVARNPQDRNDQWLITAKYFADNFTPLHNDVAVEQMPAFTAASGPCCVGCLVTRMQFIPFLWKWGCKCGFTSRAYSPEVMDSTIGNETDDGLAAALNDAPRLHAQATRSRQYSGLLTQLAAATKKWHGYETDDILPLFDRATKLGFDLQSRVHANPGKCSTALFAEWCEAEIASVKQSLQTEKHGHNVTLRDRDTYHANWQRAEKSLKQFGFEDKGGELWKPPVEKNAWAPRYFVLADAMAHIRQALQSVADNPEQSNASLFACINTTLANIGWAFTKAAACPERQSLDNPLRTVVCGILATPAEVLEAIPALVACAAGSVRSHEQHRAMDTIVDTAAGNAYWPETPTLETLSGTVLTHSRYTPVRVVRVRREPPGQQLVLEVENPLGGKVDIHPSTFHEWCIAPGNFSHYGVPQSINDMPLSATTTKVPVEAREAPRKADIAKACDAINSAVKHAGTHTLATELIRDLAAIPDLLHALANTRGNTKLVTAIKPPSGPAASKDLEMHWRVHNAAYKWGIDALTGILHGSGYHPMRVTEFREAVAAMIRATEMRQQDLLIGEVKKTPAAFGLSLSALRGANQDRCKLFKTCADWSFSDWVMALCGEVGEAANILKKVRRGDFSLDDPRGRERVAGELADAQIYLDILAASIGVDLAAATIAKFNETSAERNMPVTLSSDDWLTATENGKGKATLRTPPVSTAWKVRAAEQPLPAMLEAEVQKWLTDNNQTILTIRHGIFPCGLVRSWIARAVAAEAKNAEPTTPIWWLQNGEPIEGTPEEQVKEYGVGKTGVEKFEGARIVQVKYVTEDVFEDERIIREATVAEFQAAEAKAKAAPTPPLTTEQAAQAAAIAAAVSAGLAWWIEDGAIKSAPPVPEENGRHSYAEEDGELGACNYGCGCRMYDCRSYGSVNPFGKCPNRPPKKDPA